MRQALAGFDRHSFLVAGLLALLIWGTYSSVVLYDFAWTDDYSFLDGVHRKLMTENMQAFFNEQGRPLGGVIVQHAFRAAGSLDRLKWVRLVDLGLVWICGLILAAEMRRRVPAWIGLGVVSLILLNPALTVCVGWLTCGLLSLPAALLALLGGVGWLRALERPVARGTGFWLRLTMAGGLTLAALMIYQPAACFFLLPAAICLLDHAPRRALRESTWAAFGFMGLCAFYFAGFRCFGRWFSNPRSAIATRAELVGDIPARLRFFVGDVLRRSFESWTVFFGSTAMWMILIFAVALTLVFLVRLARLSGGRTTGVQALGLAVFLFVLGASPLLVVKGDYAPYRTLPVLYGLIAVAVGGGILALWRWLPASRRTARTAVAGLWGGLLLANSVTAAYVTLEGFVLPNVRELDLYRRFVHHRLLRYPGEVVFVLPDIPSIPRLSRFEPNHEIGTPSSLVDWSFGGLLCTVFNDEHRHTLLNSPMASGWQTIIHAVHPGDSTLFPADLPVIDGTQVLNENWMEVELPHSGRVMQDPYFGEVQQLTPTLRLSRWFGLYEVLSPTRIIHRDLGDLEVGGSGGSDCWFHRDGLGWFWTNSEVFPRLYSADRKHWLRYLRGTRQPAEFSDDDAPGHPLIRLE